MLIMFSLEYKVIVQKRLYCTSLSVAHGTPCLIEIFTLSVIEVTNLKQREKMCKKLFACNLTLVPLEIVVSPPLYPLVIN